MKEILYLDTDIMNSMLAQLDEGLINTFSMENTEQEVETLATTSTTSKGAGIKGQVKLSTGMFPGGDIQLGSDLKGSGSTSEASSKSMLDGQKDIINKAFHDYALEVLINKLHENELIGDLENLKEGDIFFQESSIRFYDFDLLSETMDVDIIKEFMLIEISHIPLTYETALKLVKKTNPTAKEREKLDDAELVVFVHQKVNEIITVMSHLKSLSILGKKLLKNLILLKSEDTVGLMKSIYLRETPESLSFRNSSKREAKILFRVVGKKESIYSGNEPFSFNEDDLDTIPNAMLDIILGSFKILKENDFLITPIAVYYE